MKTFVCERCGKSYNQYGNEKLHICDKCTDEIIDWLEENLDLVINTNAKIVRRMY